MLPRQLVSAALVIFRSVVSEEAWWCCDINSVSWQLWNRAAKKGNTVNHGICPNVSSERPRSLTSNNMMVLTSTDRPYTNLSESVCCLYPSVIVPVFMLLWPSLNLVQYIFVYLLLAQQFSREHLIWSGQRFMEQVCYCVNSVLDCFPDGQNRLLVFVSTPDENVVSWILCACVFFFL